MPRRLTRLPATALAAAPGIDVRVAVTWQARLRGLAGLPRIPPDVALLLPHTRSVHTLGMRYPLDLVWLDRDGQVIRTDRGVPPGRLRFCREASAVLERASR